MVGSEGHDPAFSHINIVASGDEKSLEQILKQLARLVDVVHARDATGQDVIQRELALIKVFRAHRLSGWRRGRAAAVSRAIQNPKSCGVRPDHHRRFTRSK
jgi:acetolactate synthase small subunit